MKVKNEENTQKLRPNFGINKLTNPNVATTKCIHILLYSQSTMDFSAAEARLKKDHNNLRSRTRNRNASRTLASSAAASKAKKAEEYRKRQLEKKKLKEMKEKKQSSYIRSGFNQVENRLGVVRELSAIGSVHLEAVSVHGMGDKITLPPSILSTLAEQDLLQSSQERGQPLFFRIGVKRDGYIFPQSTTVKEIMKEYGEQLDSKITSTSDLSKEDDFDGEICDDDDDDKNDAWMNAYLEELSCEYISYTYATVVEFSQDEDYIGLPSSVAKALLQSDGESVVEHKLTIDPAAAGKMDIDSDGVDEENAANENECLEEKTPGHAAYGLFPVPKPLLEVTLLTHLPMGQKCTLQPTADAIENGFYNLKNVKLALEQSLIRTRGSLNKGDQIYCWFRGKKFDLNVQQVIPSDVGAISCVNCDIEVDIASPGVPNVNDDSAEDADQKAKSLSKSPSGGYRLTDEVKEDTPMSSTNFDVTKRKIELPAEPPADQKEDVIVVQIRGAGKASRRRFSTSSKLRSIFDFAISEGLVESSTAAPFKLVTRFPRRSFCVNSADEDLSLCGLGLAKQEAFLIEN